MGASINDSSTWEHDKIRAQQQRCIAATGRKGEHVCCVGTEACGFRPRIPSLTCLRSSGSLRAWWAKRVFCRGDPKGDANGLCRMDPQGLPWSEVVSLRSSQSASAAPSRVASESLQPGRGERGVGGGG